MSITKHTLGPWRVESGPYYRAIRVDGEVIADVRQIGRSFNESNARLIAAAPELLEALEYAIRQIPELESVPGVKAAIAKAKSKS